MISINNVFVVFSDQCSRRLFCASYPCISQWRMSNWLCPSSVPVTHQQGSVFCWSYLWVMLCINFNTNLNVHVWYVGKWQVYESFIAYFVHPYVCVFVHVWLSPASVGVLANLQRLSECSLASAGWQVDMQCGGDVIPFPSGQTPIPRTLMHIQYNAHRYLPALPVHLEFDQQKTYPWLPSMSLLFQVLCQGHSLQFLKEAPACVVWGMVKRQVSSKLRERDSMTE